MREHHLLAAGIGSIGIVLGFMVGASATPVVSVAIPTIFALAAAAVGLVQNSQVNKEVAATIKSLSKGGEAVPELIALRDHLKTAPARLGAALLVFSVCYLAGIVLGATARTGEWLMPPRSAPPLPWHNGQAPAPPDAQRALEWIVVQHQLRKLGYGDATVEQLYAIDAKNWAQAGPALPRAPTQAPGAAAKAPQPAASAASAPAGFTDILKNLDAPDKPTLTMDPRMKEGRV